MPVDMSRYPTNWEEISLAIRQRDGWKCTQCGLPNHTIIVRHEHDKSKFIVYNPKEGWYETPTGEPIRMSEIPEGFDGKHTRVILTVHHIGTDYPDGRKGDKHDKMDCRDENLTSLCQRCHFLADLDSHIIHAQESRKKKRIERARNEQLKVGQLDMFGA